MRKLSRRICRLQCAFIFQLACIFATEAKAQAPSKELQDLQDATRADYDAKNFTSALRRAEQALPLAIRDYGSGHEQTANQFDALGFLSTSIEDYASAERYYGEALRIREGIYGTETAPVALVLESLGHVYVKTGQADAAERLFQRALAIRQQLLGADHPFAASGHANLGDVALFRRNWPTALASYGEAIRLMMKQDKSHAVVKSIVDADLKRFQGVFTGYCEAAWQTRSVPGAQARSLMDETFVAAQVSWTTSAASALAKMSARLGAGDTELGRRIRQLQDLSDRLIERQGEDQKLLSDWNRVQRADPVYGAALEDFRAVSIARNKAVAPVAKRQSFLVERLTALLTRCPPGQSKAGCEAVAREQEAIGKELNELSKAASAGTDDLMAVYRRMEAAEKALPGYAAFSTRRSELRNEIARSDRDVFEARTEIVKAFPDYAALADPKPLPVREAQALLKGDEALVALLVGSKTSFVWAVSRDRAEWAEIDAGNETLARHVAALRAGLDPSAQQDAEGSPGSRLGIISGFDVGLAHQLYKLLFGPIGDVISGKQHLIVVPAGPLTSLPLQVLVTEPSVSQGGSAREALRSASWLIKRHAISVLPSVQSLSALRHLPGPGTAAKPFFGIGDPVFDGSSPNPQRKAARAAAHFYRNGLPDAQALRELAPLPETADEVRLIASILGAPPEATLLGEAASETRVKSTKLDDYRVVHFATHGLVAGDLSGLTEPALVLTPPQVPTEVDDGLLTSSEVATLKLNADWVVLSACNTASGEGASAEALSGLARAFFYAGARALLVSHWEVYSSAAVDLTTTTFATLAANPGIGRAEAFRRAMLKLIGDGQPPSYWAPFVIVGEGGRESIR